MVQIERSGTFLQDGSNGHGGLDLLKLHIQEIKQAQSDPDGNRKLGARVFVGKLALVGLAEIAESNLPIPQKEPIDQILQDERAKFLLEHFNLQLARIEKNHRKNGERTKEDRELLTIVDRYKIRLRNQLGGLGGDNDRKIIEAQVTRAKKGIEAYDQLIKGNLGLALMWAAKFHNHPLGLEYLLSHAQEGLMLAAAKYNFRRGFRFSTFASWWIRQKITRAIEDNGSTIRIPVHIHGLLKIYQKVQGQLTQTLGREPTLAEIAQAAGLNRENIAAALQTQQVASLNTTTGDRHESEWEDLIGDPSENVEDQVETEIDLAALQKTIRQVLSSTLTPRQIKVLSLRFGLEDGRPRSLEEVGVELSVTRERIRQIQQKALNKLRHPRTLAILRRLQE